MFCSRTANKKIDRLHERSLRLCNSNYTASFDDLLRESNNVRVHTKNLQTLMLEIYKCTNGLSPPIMNGIFNLRNNPFNLRNYRELKCQNINTVRYGLNTISYKGPQLWQQLSQSIKSSNTPTIFKNRIKSWKNANCTCNLCKEYIMGLGFL